MAQRPTTNHDINKDELTVVNKIIAGNGIFVSSSGADAGTGFVTLIVSGTNSSSCETAYPRVEQPIPINSSTGTLWRVPDNVYASGSLGVFYNGLLQLKGSQYEELIYVSGTYHLLFIPSAGASHMVSYGVPCTAQSYSTGTGSPFLLVDIDSIVITDSDGIELTDSDG